MTKISSESIFWRLVVIPSYSLGPTAFRVVRVLAARPFDLALFFPHNRNVRATDKIEIIFEYSCIRHADRG